MCISVVKEVIIKATGRVNSLLEWWGGGTKYPRYHTYRFHIYSNFPNKMDPYVAYSAKRSIKYYVQINS